MRARYTGTMYGISARQEQLRSSSLGEGGGHGKKCHIILLYGDAAHRSLRKFILLHRDSVCARSLVEESIAYTVLWELRNPGYRGWIANRVSSFAFRQRYIRAFALRYELPHGTSEMGFISRLIDTAAPRCCARNDALRSSS